MVDGQVNNLKNAEEKRIERKSAQRPKQLTKKETKEKRVGKSRDCGKNRSQSL